MAKLYIVLQARTNSTRLPRKVLKKVGNSTTLLEFIFKRLDRFKDSLYLFTSTNSSDEVLKDICVKNGVKYYRGSLNNVLDRFYSGLLYYSASDDDVIVRLTADNPFIDSQLLGEMLDEFNSSGVDYMSNTINRTFPKGLDIEIFSFKTLKEAKICAVSEYEKEHVTPYIYEHKSKYKLKNYANSKDYSQYSVTVDTFSDYENIDKLLKRLGREDFNYKELFKVLY